jgi:glycosyltransferase involved in cell wall biosynthesis
MGPRLYHSGRTDATLAGISGKSPRRMRSRVLVVVPAFNEAGNVGRLVAEVRALPERVDVVVIDDGSLDGTVPAASAAGARVIRLPFNCGIGAAVQTGIRFALDEGYTFAARLDGDGQHDPRALAPLLRPLEAGTADFVIGSRYLERHGFQSSAARRLGSRWFSALLRVLCGQRISDPTSGLWAANRRAAAVLASEYASDYPEVDAILHLARRRCVVAEVPVAMRARQAGRSSIDGPRALYYMLKVTVALATGRLQTRT